MLHALRHCEATQDFHTGSMKQINPLIQFDPQPNRELKETKTELYKISISFEAGGNINTRFLYLIPLTCLKRVTFLLRYYR